MKAILSDRDRRYLTILETLFNHDDLTLTKLAVMTRSSKRNLQNDIKVLNSLIDPMYISTSLKEGCFLSSPRNYSIDYLYRCILTNSLEFSLLELIFFERYERLEDYADALFVSLSTLKRLIKHINETTKPAGFYISTSPVELLGEERALCNTMFHYFNEAYLFNELPFPKVQIDALKKIIEDVLNEHNGYSNFPDLVQLQITMLVSIVRIQKYPDSSVKTELPAIFDESLLSNILIKHTFKSVFKIELTIDTISRLFAQFIHGEFAYNTAHLKQLQASDALIIKRTESIERMLDTLSSDFDIPLDNKEELILILFNVTNMMIGKSYVIYNKKHIFIQNFIQNAPHLTDFIYKGIQKASRLDRKFYPYELEELTYIFITHWTGFADKIVTMKPRFSAGVFMDSDIEHSEFLSSIFRYQFKQDISFHVMEARTIKESVEESTKYDLIVTNMSGIPHGFVPYICVGLYPTPDDFKKIWSVYQSLIRKKNTKRETLGQV